VPCRRLFFAVVASVVLVGPSSAVSAPRIGGACAPWFPTMAVEIRGHFSESRFAGVLIVTGHLEDTASVSARLRTGRKEHWRRALSPSQPAGTFELSTSVPTDFRPGTYTVEVRVDNPLWTHVPPVAGCLRAGGSSPTGYECRAAPVSVPPPPEGYVHRAYLSRARDGSSVHRIAATSKEAWAWFEFWLNPVTGENALPRGDARLSIAWLQPGGQALSGSIQRPSRYATVSHLRSAGPLRKGSWRVLLRADGVTVKRVAFSVR
jgi:hypothetical protein